MRAIFARIIVTCDSSMRVLRDHWIVVDDEGRISCICKELPRDVEEKIEYGHHIVMPGFVNTHTHVPMTILRGLKDDVDLKTWLEQYIFPAEAKLRGDDIYYGALHGIAEMLSSGITTFNDMYYFEGRIAQAVAEAGVRAVLSRGILDIPTGLSPEAALKKAHGFLSRLEQLWSRDPKLRDRIWFAYGPHAPYTCSRELLQAVREEASRRKFRIHIHLAETRWEFEKFKRETGMTPTEYLESLGFLGPDVMAAHVVWTTDRDLDILARRGVKVLHNPTSNLKLASGIARVPDMLARGICVGLATDGPASNNRLDMFREMLMAALIHKGTRLDPKVMDAKTVVRMATIEGARCLGLEDKLGSIEPGKFADLVVLDLRRPYCTPMHDVYSLIVYTMTSDAVEAVYVGGELVWERERGPVRFDLERVLEKVEEVRHRITQT